MNANGALGHSQEHACLSVVSHIPTPRSWGHEVSLCCEANGPLKYSDPESCGSLSWPVPLGVVEISHRGYVLGECRMSSHRDDWKGGQHSLMFDQSRPQIRRDYPLNLSISISGGKETNQDSLSNGERTGNSSNFKSRMLASANCSFQKRYPHEGGRSKLLGTAYQRG